MAARQTKNEATEFADTLHRHGDPDPKQWDGQAAVTGRKPDTPQRGVDKPAVANSTLAERAQARLSASKRVDREDVEDKAVSKATTKGSPRS